MKEVSEGGEAAENLGEETETKGVEMIGQAT